MGEEEGEGEEHEHVDAEAECRFGLHLITLTQIWAKFIWQRMEMPFCLGKQVHEEGEEEVEEVEVGEDTER